MGREDPLEEEMATHSSILAWQATVLGVTKSRTQLSMRAGTLYVDSIQSFANKSTNIQFVSTPDHVSHSVTRTTETNGSLDIFSLINISDHLVESIL